MLPKLIFSVAVAIIFFQTGTTMQQKDISGFFPEVIDGWQQTDPGRCFNADNLYEHINGGAELFISYQFISACTRTYSQGDQAEISIDIFDMGQPKNAFGVFGHSRETTDRTVGQGCQLYEDAVIFWQDRYYVAITCFRCPVNIQDVLLKMARHVSGAIGKEGDMPGIFSKLPRGHLHEESILYFNHHAWQNAFYYFGDENYFNIDRETDAIMARYDFDKDQLYAMLIQYPDNQKAGDGLMNFRQKYLEGEKERLVKLEDGYWLGADQKDNFVVVVFHAMSGDHAEALLLSVLKKL